MWSGPRTISTALMRSWENRHDTIVVDEPLYAFYLVATSLEHPGRAEVIASQSADWRTVLRGLAEEPLPPGISVYYQKHMTHHLLPAVDRAALAPLRHAFLIRDPRRLLASYARVRSAPTLDDLGLRQQVQIFEHFGGPVIESADLLAARTARQRRRVGALLVRQRDPVDRVRPGRGVWRATCIAARARRAGGTVRAVLRETGAVQADLGLIPALPPPYAVGVTTCCRSSTNATAT